jgi:hypothetical protein
VARDEQLARRVGELEEMVRELVEQNIELKRAASDFGALAERLTAQLRAERDAGRIARYLVRT